MAAVANASSASATASSSPATAITRDTESIKRDLRHVFDSLDVNKDGSLDFNELQQGFRKAGFNYNDEQVRKMIEAADTNKNSTVEFDEFYKFVSKVNSSNLLTISEYWKQYSTKSFKRDASESAWKLLFAGGVAGAVSRTCTSPLERLKILNQVRGMKTIGNNEYQGVVRSLVQMVQIEGIGGLFKGNGTNVIRIAPYSAVQFLSYERYKEMFLGHGSSAQPHLSATQNLVAGGFAGVTSLLCTYPLDLVRSRLTIQTTETKYIGIFDTFRLVVREEGYRALYKGLWPSILGIAPYVAINFTTYETLKRRFTTPHRPPSVGESLAYGAFSGAVAQTVTYPIDLLRRRFQLQGIGGQPAIYNGTVHAIRTIVQKEGVLALYRGMLPCYLKVIPAISISFCVYELMRKLLGIEQKRVSTSSSF